MRTRLIVLGAVAVVALSLAASAAPTCVGTACSDLTFTQKNVGGIGEVNILFGAGGVGPAGPAMLITGHTVNHGMGSFPVDFTSSQNVFSSGGQSDVDPCTGGTVPADCPTGTIKDLTITVPGATPGSTRFFQDLITDPQLLNETGDLHAVVTLINGDTATFGPYGNHLNGENFLTIQANAGVEIKSVEITSTLGYDDFKQPRISGIEGLVLTPEPSSMLMLGSGVLLFAQLLRRKLWHEAPRYGEKRF